VRALVTGGAGFIGSHLADSLDNDGFDVVVIDNLSSGSVHNVSESWNFIEGDIRDPACLLKVGPPVDIVYHLASHVGQELSYERPVHDFEVNALGTSILAQWALETGNPFVVFASSMNVYGDPMDGVEFVCETTPTNPPSPYAVAKLASEGILQVLEAIGLRSASLRLFNVYGPRQDLNNMKQGMVSIFLSFILNSEPITVRGSLDRFRDFIYVDDVVAAFRHLGDKNLTGMYNVGTAERTTVSELLTLLLQAMDEDPSDYPVVIAEGTIKDQFGVYANNSLLRSTGWEPTVPLDRGLAKIATWARTSRFANLHRES